MSTNSIYAPYKKFCDNHHLKQLNIIEMNVHDTLYFV